jgi:methionine aminopeptidase
VAGRKADVVQAAYLAAEAALRKIKVGAQSSEVVAAIDAIAKDFGVEALKGIYSYQMKQHQLDGGNAIPNSLASGNGSPSFQFGLNEVYGVDVIFTTGDGNAKETDLRTTVLKRAHEHTYVVKTQKGREFLAEVGRVAPTLCFSLRQFEDALVAKAGAAEARRHRLVEEFPVLKDREGEVVAQFKFTALLLPGGTKRVTGGVLGLGPVESAKSVTSEELKNLLASSANPKKMKLKLKASELAAAAKE